MNVLMMLSVSKYLSEHASELWQELKLDCELEFDLRDTVDSGRKWLVDFIAGKLSLFSLTSLITLVLLM